MLIREFKIGEAFRLGDDVTVTIMPGHTHQKVKLAIAAPNWVKVQRAELYGGDKRDEVQP